MKEIKISGSCRIVVGSCRTTRYIQEFISYKESSTTLYIYFNDVLDNV